MVIIFLVNTTYDESCNFFRNFRENKLLTTLKYLQARFVFLTEKVKLKSKIEALLFLLQKLIARAILSSLNSDLKSHKTNL